MLRIDTQRIISLACGYISSTDSGLYKSSIFRYMMASAYVFCGYISSTDSGLYKSSISRYMMASTYVFVFRFTDPLWGNIDEFTSLRASDPELWRFLCCLIEQVVDMRHQDAQWCHCNDMIHGDVIKWKHFPRSPVNSPHKGQWRGALMFSLIYVWINGWVNNREAGDLRRYRANYDVTVMWYIDSVSKEGPLIWLQFN